ncbi:MRG/MORF4L-binding protein [Trichoplax sp. H2]|uniref:MRG-binding protein n=1 Tax=Trichoplax adhaerens TaxID=10228 RepID=B3S4V5_TRIAD|nr:hypothetical protein TRIADDRAFT_59360 [Trichoplax adhaerens]EDV22277.1 hypothetical protein TRIADDRAFT_59360 [Trichoplax adhaerens]RDD37932.1 MRG/MORF4L-binding protein [Trichoplax sp. H2]|eukprot:XP_002115432.1 hypothetical protein TRIADDRAFT_59360 [Trichoplax adhaerens]
MATEATWTADMEVKLFRAMKGHKPVGVHKHFQMAFIHQRLQELTGENLSVKSVWDHLNTLYDLAALDEMEIYSMPTEEVDFSLPEDYISESALPIVDDDSSPARKRAKASTPQPSSPGIKRKR